MKILLGLVLVASALIAAIAAYQAGDPFRVFVIMALLAIIAALEEIGASSNDAK